MIDLLSLLHIGGALTIVGICGVALQAVAVFLAARKRRLSPVLLSGVAMVALLLVCYLMVEHRWATVVSAVQGADPATRQALLDPSPRLTSLQVFLLGAVLLMLQALLGAVAVGLTAANRSSADDPEDTRRLRPGAAVGVALASVGLTVVPLAAGVVMFYQRWQEVFRRSAGADPFKRCELLLAGLPEPRVALSRGATIAAVGLLLSCALIALLTLRRRPRATCAPGTLIAVVVCCAAASMGLWQMARRYRLDAPPPGGPLARYLELRQRPHDWIDRVRKHPDLLAGGMSNVVISDDMVPPRSTARGSCREALSVTVTQRAIIIEGDAVATVKRGAVDASVKRDGPGGYLIDPLYTRLRSHARRLKKIEKGTGRRMQFEDALKLVVDHRTPYRLVAKVLYSAGQAGFSRFRFVTLSVNHSDGCVEIHAPEEGASHTPGAGGAPLALTVAVAYKGFIVGSGGQVLKGPDGEIPSIKCALVLRDGRCPAARSDGYDYKALSALAAKMKGNHPRDRRVILTADRHVPFQVVVRTVDALRGVCQGSACTLFDQVHLAAGVE